MASHTYRFVSPGPEQQPETAPPAPATALQQGPAPFTSGEQHTQELPTVVDVPPVPPEPVRPAAVRENGHAVERRTRPKMPRWALYAALGAGAAAVALGIASTDEGQSNLKSFHAAWKANGAFYGGGGLETSEQGFLLGGGVTLRDDPHANDGDNNNVLATTPERSVMFLSHPVVWEDGKWIGAHVKGVMDENGKPVDKRVWIERDEIDQIVSFDSKYELAAKQAYERGKITKKELPAYKATENAGKAMVDKNVEGLVVDSGALYEYGPDTAKETARQIKADAAENGYPLNTKSAVWKKITGIIGR